VKLIPPSYVMAYVRRQKNDMADAAAIATSVTEPSMFKSNRELASFFGLVPRQSSSGGKERLARISKMGDRYIRKLLVVGATAVLRHARKGGSALKIWTDGLLQRKPYKPDGMSALRSAIR